MIAYFALCWPFSFVQGVIGILSFLQLLLLLLLTTCLGMPAFPLPRFISAFLSRVADDVWNVPKKPRHPLSVITRLVRIPSMFCHFPGVSARSVFSISALPRFHDPTNERCDTLSLLFHISPPTPRLNDYNTTPYLAADE